MSTWACDRRGAGALVDLVEVQKLKADATTNDGGEILQHDNANWETHCTEWAEIQLSGGDESNQPTQQVGIRMWRLRVRWHGDTQAITQLMRVVLPDQSQPLYITWAGDPDRQRRWIEIAAKERTT